MYVADSLTGAILWVEQAETKVTILKMEGVPSSETTHFYQIELHHTPEDCILQYVTQKKSLNCSRK
jgi:hypothetical protein